jgi:hypothetical protein
MLRYRLSQLRAVFSSKRAGISFLRIIQRTPKSPNLINVMSLRAKRSFAQFGASLQTYLDLVQIQRMASKSKPES